MRNYSKENPLLMIPGPTMVPDIVMSEIAKQVLPHRSPEFSNILKNVYENLKYVFQTDDDVFIFPSSGTGAMCSALENLINPNDKVLCLVNGVFSNRFAQIANARGANVKTISVPYGSVISVEKVEQYLCANSDTKIVTLACSETSTGALNDIKNICSVIRKTDAISVVDGISAVGIVDCKKDEWGIDVLVSASQKGFLCPPGLSFLSASERAYKIFKQCNHPSFYFNWDFYKDAVKNNTVPCTPAINLIMGLNKSLEIIKEIGLEHVISNYAKYSYKMRQALKSIGISLFTKDSESSNAVTSFYVPDGFEAEQIRNILKEKYHIIIANGQKELKDKILRVGTIGDISDDDIDYTIQSLGEILRN